MQLEMFDVPLDEIKQEEPKKKCSQCKEMLPYRYFGSNRAKSLGLSCTCKKCEKEGRDVLKVLHKNHPLQNPEEYKCTICNRSKEDIYTGSKQSENPWRLDHCKINNEFRGWICDSCNTGLGKFRDDPDVLEKALKYLKDYYEARA